MERISCDPDRQSLEMLARVWLGVFCFAIIVVLASGRSGKDVDAAGVMFLAGAFGYIGIRRTLRNLVDEVFDGGESLVVERNGIRDSISISNISRVSASTRPARIHLFLSARIQTRSGWT